MCGGIFVLVLSVLSSSAYSATSDAPDRKKPAAIAIVSPRRAGRLALVENICGTAFDPVGLKKINVSILDQTVKGGWHRGNPTMLPVSGTTATWKYPGFQDEMLEQGHRYRVNVEVWNSTGGLSSAKSVEFEFYDRVISAIEDRGKGEGAVIKAIQGMAKSSATIGVRIRTLIDATYDQGDNVGNAAAWELARIGREALVPVLDRLFMGRYTHVPYLAQALGSMSPDLQRDAIPRLRDHLGQRVPDARYRALWTLCYMHNAGPVAHTLITGALRDPDPQVRGKAAEAAFARRPLTASTEAISGLIEILGRDDYEARANAAEALGAIGRPAQEALLPLLQGASTATKTFAAIAMASISSQAAIGAVPIIADVLKSTSPVARRASLDALAKIGKPAESVGPQIIAALGDPVFFVNVSAGMALDRVDPDTPESRQAILAALAKVDQGGRAAWLLSRRGPAAGWALPALVAAFKADTAWIDNLGDIPKAKGKQCSSGNPSLNVAAEAIASIGKEAFSTLVELSRSENPCHRTAALWALGQVPKSLSSRSLSILVKAWDDQTLDAATRNRLIVEAIGSLGAAAKPVAPRLLAASYSFDLAQSIPAREALVSIGGLKFSDLKVASSTKGPLDLTLGFLPSPSTATFKALVTIKNSSALPIRVLSPEEFAGQAESVQPFRFLILDSRGRFVHREVFSKSAAFFCCSSASGPRTFVLPLGSKSFPLTLTEPSRHSDYRFSRPGGGSGWHGGPLSPGRYQVLVWYHDSVAARDVYSDPVDLVVKR